MSRATVSPFLLSAGIIMLDQITKAAVSARIPLNSIGAQYFGDLLRLIHVRNEAIAFSIGAGAAEPVRIVLFILLPLVLLGVIAWMILKNSDLTALQRISCAVILGGGVGNIIDRIFRSGGVVDFIDVKFYGLFGLERWPAFNVADSAIVVGGFLLIGTILFHKEPSHE